MAAREAWEFAVTIPAGTTKSNAQLTSIATPVRRIESVKWRVPRGAHGLMGWQLWASNARVAPVFHGTWFVVDGQMGSFDLPGLPDSGDWQINGYNLGAFDHTVYITLIASPIVAPPHPIALTPGGMFAPVSDLSAVGAPVRSAR